jgi:hypothetical protein
MWFLGWFLCATWLTSLVSLPRKKKWFSHIFQGERKCAISFIHLKILQPKFNFKKKAFPRPTQAFPLTFPPKT